MPHITITPEEGKQFKVEKTNCWQDETLCEYKISIDGISLYVSPAQKDQLSGLLHDDRITELEKQLEYFRKLYSKEVA